MGQPEFERSNCAPRHSQCILGSAAATSASEIETPKRTGKTNAVKLVGICPELSSTLSGSQILATHSSIRLYSSDKRDTAIAGPKALG